MIFSKYIQKKTLSANKFLLLVCFITILGSNNAIAQVNDSLLVGTWTFDHITTFGNMDPNIKMEMDTIPAFNAKVISLFVGRKVVFHSNGNYQHILSNGEVTNGIWVVNGQILFITDVNGKVHRQSLAGLSEYNLEFEPILQNGARAFIPRYYFLKN